jgi:hypothetical protein
VRLKKFSLQKNIEAAATEVAENGSTYKSVALGFTDTNNEISYYVIPLILPIINIMFQNILCGLYITLHLCNTKGLYIP